jgi:CheY-like chemotaxis protein
MENPKTKILVVDDDQQAREFMKAMLIPRGYEVNLAKDGNEVMGIARTQKLDLILLDIFMPVIDGYTTLHNLKADTSTKNIPVVMVSAVGYDLNKELADGLGAAGYITKPVELTELLGKVTSVLHRSA